MSAKIETSPVTSAHKPPSLLSTKTPDKEMIESAKKTEEATDKVMNSSETKQAVRQRLVQVKKGIEDINLQLKQIESKIDESELNDNDDSFETRILNCCPSRKCLIITNLAFSAMAIVCYCLEKNWVDQNVASILSIPR